MPTKERKDMLDINEINRQVLQVADHYSKLKAFGREVVCPYYINRPVAYFTDLMRQVGIGEEQITSFYDSFKHNTAPYGWYQGKGTPEQIEDTIKYFLPNAGFGKPKVTPEGIRDLMRLRGVGIDCSGFVFNILNLGFQKMGLSDIFIDSIKWKDNKKNNVFQAGVSVLAESSYQIDQKDLQALDLLVMEKRGHIAIVLKDSDGNLKVYQSTPWISPSGVNVSSISVEKGKAIFTFVPSMGDSWNEMNDRGEIEFRRLNLIKYKQ